MDKFNKGLYDSSLEHDACGIGFITQIKGERSHRILREALGMLSNMEHRGGHGIDERSGDGAGVMTSIPHKLFERECKKLLIEIPKEGDYGVGMIFFPKDRITRTACRNILINYINELGFELLGFRRVPTKSNQLGKMAVDSELMVEQIFVSHKDIKDDPDSLERKLFILRKASTHEIQDKVGLENYYVSSMSCKKIVYKGQFTTNQVDKYFPDLLEELYQTSFAIVHSRFSTNTFPKWKLAQPFRFISHNGEINTIRGNVNWMLSNQTLLESTLFTKEEIKMILPICNPNNSDSANLDNIVELLVMGGRSLAHTFMMLIPEAWQCSKEMNKDKRAFYDYYSSIMEPWDGPASICFTDGNVIGAVLDRNGLRPSRFCITKDNYVMMSSEVGSFEVKPENVKEKGRLQPGKMFIIDHSKGKIISDEDIKGDIIRKKPYSNWLKHNRIRLVDIKQPMSGISVKKIDYDSLLIKQISFGISKEDIEIILKPMCDEGKEPIGSMGADIPLSLLSNHPQHLSYYFKQQFAQVSNPPIDSIRERLVMSLATSLGRSFNILAESPSHCKRIDLDNPILTNEDLDKIRSIEHTNFRTEVIYAIFKSDSKKGRLREALDDICQLADKAIIDEGKNIILLSDRFIDKGYAPIPSLLAVSTLHQHLIKNGLRVRVGIISESGDSLETHHFSTLIGYGANAVNPYLALDTINYLNDNGYFKNGLSLYQAKTNYINAINSGLLKIFSKMGISTLQSYHGAQIFESIGISSQVIDHCFKGTICRLEGLGFDDIAKEVLIRYNSAINKKNHSGLITGGIYRWKRRGEKHMLNPKTINLIQQASWNNDYNIYKRYRDSILDLQIDNPITIRSLLEFRDNKSISIDQVESVDSILKRFISGAMSFGSISYEAHSTIAIAMNRIGAKSNSGEGGEDEIRFKVKDNGDWESSATKQIASGRFGVTSNYLTNAKELQIKMAQGAKPGEGGQLPGHKVDDWIGRVRHSTPGVGLISPPPHHDIYSIEDLAQLIYDLKNANRKADINVKLTSKSGVGTIAAGVAKAHADTILISGYDGGTGASPLSSIRHAGVPWEIGLAEAHQTLVKNKLRNRVTLQTDGQIRIGKDIAVATLLGAEEWGVATALLIVEGCIMMRKCHLNTCPVGIATQNPELREVFKGKPEYIVNFLRFIAKDFREIMADLGFRTVNEMVGKASILKPKDDMNYNWKLKNINLSKIIYEEPSEINLFKDQKQQHKLEKVLDRVLIKSSKDAINGSNKIYKHFPIKNTDRSVGAMLSNEISKIHGSKGLADGTIHFKFKGSAGQSFGVFTTKGIRFELEGEANDYFGKGLSGAELIIYPDRQSTLKAEDNIIIGNVAFYGATSGVAFINGKAGERFCVRNSGVNVVVEGIGDHGCEYMTGGRVIVLGYTGRNFAAGMSGGIAYIFDKDRSLNIEGQVKHSLFIDKLDIEDEIFVRNMVLKHYRLTNSSKAKSIIDNWDIISSYFTKIIPFEYKNILDNKNKKYKNQLTLSIGKITGFLDYDREMPIKINPRKRIKNYQEFYLDFDKKKLNQQSSRCMDCGVPFCHKGCPLGNIIPEFNDAVYNNKWKDAYRILSSTNNFPEFTGRICPAPCESSCVLSINKNPVTIELIEKNIIEEAFSRGYVKAEFIENCTGKRVAIVGSGPAGMAAAVQLNKAGHIVELFEKEDKVGGLLRYGIPDFKLEKWVIDRRVNLMEQEGIIIRTNTHVGKDISIDTIKNDFDAVLLAGGCSVPRQVNLDMNKIKGVYFAMDYLTQQNKRNSNTKFNKEEILATGKDVVILGGGDTGADCVGTANRQGAKSILQLDINSKPSASSTNWPDPLKFVTSTSHEEGCVRKWSILAKELIGDKSGNLIGIKLVDVKMEVDKHGKKHLKELKQTSRILKCDLVLIAAGFIGANKLGLLDDIGVEVNDRGQISTNNYKTNIDKVFAAGDIRRGQSLVVWAISEGREAAREIDKCLMGNTELESKSKSMYSLEGVT